jgi:putative endonuclease
METWVYILLCADGRYYIGSFRGDDPAIREAEHNAGKYPDAWTYRRRPVNLVFAAEFPTAMEAIAFERQIKGWTRAKREALIRGDLQALPALARRYSRPEGEEPLRGWPRPRPSTDGPFGPRSG